MTQSEVYRLIKWLEMQGFSDSQIVECIKYIETGKIEKSES